MYTLLKKHYCKVPVWEHMVRNITSRTKKRLMTLKEGSWNKYGRKHSAPIIQWNTHGLMYVRLRGKYLFLVHTSCSSENNFPSSPPQSRGLLPEHFLPFHSQEPICNSLLHILQISFQLLAKIINWCNIIISASDP